MILGGGQAARATYFVRNKKVVLGGEKWLYLKRISIRYYYRG